MVVTDLAAVAAVAEVAAAVDWLQFYVDGVL